MLSASDDLFSRRGLSVVEQDSPGLLLLGLSPTPYDSRSVDGQHVSSSRHGSCRCRGSDCIVPGTEPLGLGERQLRHLLAEHLEWGACRGWHGDTGGSVPGRRRGGPRRDPVLSVRALPSDRGHHDDCLGLGAHRFLHRLVPWRESHHHRARDHDCRRSPGPVWRPGRGAGHCAHVVRRQHRWTEQGGRPRRRGDQRHFGLRRHGGRQRVRWWRSRRRDRQDLQQDRGPQRHGQPRRHRNRQYRGPRRRQLRV